MIQCDSGARHASSDEDLIEELFPEGEPAALRPGRRRQGSNSSEIHRGRLLTSLTHTMAEKGYAATRVADISRAARVSSRTFYEHFADKADAFLAAYVLAGDVLFQQVKEITDDCDDWGDRIMAGFRTYLASLDKHPAVTRLFLFETPGESDVIRPDKVRILEKFSRFLVEHIARARAEDERLRAVTRELTPELAYGVVVGVNEMVLRGLEHGRTAMSMLEPCLVLYGSAVNASSHEFARLMLERSGGRELEELLDRERALSRPDVDLGDGALRLTP